MANLDFIYQHGKPNGADLAVLEEHAMTSQDLAYIGLAYMIRQYRELQHELENPNFMYSGGRATRQAIVCRNMEIDALRSEISALKAARI